MAHMLNLQMPFPAHLDRDALQRIGQMQHFHMQKMAEENDKFKFAIRRSKELYEEKNAEVAELTALKAALEGELGAAKESADAVAFRHATDMQHLASEQAAAMAGRAAELEAVKSDLRSRSRDQSSISAVSHTSLSSGIQETKTALSLHHVVGGTPRHPTRVVYGSVFDARSESGHRLRGSQ